MSEAVQTRITPAQLKRLQTLCGKLCTRDRVPAGMERAYRLLWVGRRVRQDVADLAAELDSFKALTKSEAARALELLAAEFPGQPRRRKRSGPEAGRAGRRGTPSGPATIASGSSLAMIGTLRSQLAWSNDDKFLMFVRRQLRGGNTIRTEADANKVIWAMKGILRRGQRLTQKATTLGSEITAQVERGSVVAGDGPGLSACSGCSGSVDGDPHGLDAPTSARRTLEEKLRDPEMSDFEKGFPYDGERVQP